jgi:hypothetical protein
MVNLANNGKLPVPREPTDGVSTHTAQCQTYLNEARYGIDLTDDASEDFEKLTARVLAIAEFRSALEGQLEGNNIVSTSKWIKSMAAWRRRALKVQSHYHPTTWLEASKLSKRLGVTRGSFNMVALRMAMANRMKPWFLPR